MGALLPDPKFGARSALCYPSHHRPHYSIQPACDCVDNVAKRADVALGVRLPHHRVGPKAHHPKLKVWAITHSSPLWSVCCVGPCGPDVSISKTNAFSNATRNVTRICSPRGLMDKTPARRRRKKIVSSTLTVGSSFFLLLLPFFLFFFSLSFSSFPLPFSSVLDSDRG